MNNVLLLYSIVSLAVIVSLLKSKEKTKKSFMLALKIFLMMLPMLLAIVSVVSVALYFLPDYVIAEYLGSNDNGMAVLLALILGSISLLPGFITFPLSGLLLNQGVGYFVLGAFTTSLMMVGIITFPMEKKFFGTKLTVLRNISGFVIAIVVSLCIGIFYGEVM